MVPLNAYLLVAAFLFITGVVGVATRRNALIIFMSVELM
ncbi:MAG: NADH-quinone oxidoreductase subunit K, partial [Candidatus Methylomirabilales bacterium]